VITVTPEPNASPPRNVITVSVSDPVNPDEVIQSISVYRRVSGVRELLRSQPTPGGSVAVAIDYEAPYGVPVTYEAEYTWSDDSGLTVVWSEDWSSLSEWTQTGTLTWGVSGGALTVGSVGSDRVGTISRALPTGRYRIEFSTPLTLPPEIAAAYLQWPTAGDWAIAVEGGLYRIVPSPAFDPGTGAWSIDMLAGLIRVTTTAGVWTAAVDDSSIVDGVFRLTAGAATGVSPTSVLGAMTVYEYGAIEAASDSSAPVTLTPVNGWLIHPTKTNRSVELTRGWDGIDVASAGPVRNAATSTVHRVIGARRPTVTAAGVRQGDEFTLELTTSTLEQRDRVRTLVDDQVPILINLLPEWEYDLPYGFYAVLDVDTTRLVQGGGFPYRYIRLPLVAVEPPVASLEETGWSWAQLAVEFPTWNAVLDAFESWNDVLLNVRREGF